MLDLRDLVNCESDVHAGIKGCIEAMDVNRCI